MQYSGPVNHGTITVASTPAAESVELGYEPGYVAVYNATNGTSLIWTNTMADASGIKTVTAGTQTFETSNGITLVNNTADTVDGFTIGTMTDLNDTATEVLHWVAMRSSDPTA